MLKLDAANENQSVAWRYFQGMKRHVRVSSGSTVDKHAARALFRNSYGEWKKKYIYLHFTVGWVFMQLKKMSRSRPIMLTISPYYVLVLVLCACVHVWKHSNPAEYIIIKQLLFFFFLFDERYATRDRSFIFFCHNSKQVVTVQSVPFRQVLLHRVTAPGFLVSMKPFQNFVQHELIKEDLIWLKQLFKVKLGIYIFLITASFCRGGNKKKRPSIHAAHLKKKKNLWLLIMK